MPLPSCVYGIANPAATIMIVVTTRNLLGLLSTNGTLSVLMMWMMKVCVHSDSRNQMVWKTGAAAIVVSPNTNHETANVMMSNTELIGPKSIMKLRIALMFHGRGFARYSLSTPSQGIATCDMS